MHVSRTPAIIVPLLSSFSRLCVFAPLRETLSRVRQPLLAAALACSPFLLLSPHSAPAADLAKARTLLMHGRYEEATEIYKPQAAADPQAALGLAACQEAQGKSAAAEKTLKPLAEKQADVQAQLARLAFERGDCDEARRRVEETLKLAAEHPLALYIKAELARTSGRIEEAERGYHRLIEFYNNHDVKKPDAIRWIGRAAAQYARWNRLSDQFDFLVNELYPEAVKLDADYWPAHFEAGLLFMEKYNRADAAKEFQAALEINPRAAEVHAAMAELAMEDFHVEQAEASLRRALEINPKLPDAWQMRADLAWLNDDLDESLRLLREKLLPLNPRDESALARIAACYLLLDSQSERSGGTSLSGHRRAALVDEGRVSPTPPRPSQAQGRATRSRRFDELVAEVTKRNPHCGEFYGELAEMLETRHKQAAAEKYFREAIRVLPRQPRPHAGLGLLLMRLGREAEARKTLQEAFDADPFHVRVKNSLDVLDVVEAMQTRRTPHFIIKYAAADGRLVPYLAPHLEKIYGELQQEFGYAPPGPTPVEVFNESQGQSGHSWFSARMVGLPYLGTVAASTGQIVAMVSPGETEIHGGYAWARTLKHEMTHVFNLQQTGYNIPHWFTEGLAVYNEQIPRPYRWVVLLRRRAAAAALMNLDNVNAGFARAMEGDDCNLAYCQSELYVEYMLTLGGPGVLKQTVAAYAETPATAAVIQRVFGKSKAEFERGYTAFLQKQIDAVPVLAEADARKLTREAGAKLKAEKYDEAAALYARGEGLDPANPQWPAAGAKVYLAAGRSRDLAQALAHFAELEPNDLPSREKLAALAMEQGDAAAARRWATAALEINVERAAAHRLLAASLVKLNDLDRAIEEYTAAVEIDPANPAQRFDLADALLQAHKPAAAKKVLKELLRRDRKYPNAADLLESLENRPYNGWKKEEHSNDRNNDD
jgi:tetratricopeptide (TPR) repeat protein